MPALWSALLAGATVAIALFAQARLDARVTPQIAAGALLAAALAFGIIARPHLKVRQTAPEKEAPLSVNEGAVAIAGLAAAGMATLFQGDNQFLLWPSALWLAGIFSACFALSGIRPSLASTRGWLAEHRAGFMLSWWGVGLLGILAVAAALRFYRLAEVPAEMGPDIPLNFENIKDILRGQWPVFTTRFPGRESLFFYLGALVAWPFGVSHLTIKAMAVLVGLSTILVAYFVGRRLFDRQTGLLLAALMAVDRWHLTLSRYGYRAVLIPLFFLLALWFGARAIDTGRRREYVALGVVTGLGLYTYNSFMLMPAVILVGLLGQGIWREGLVWLRRSWPGLLAWLGVTLAIFAPLARFGVQHPESYLLRVASRVSGSEQPLPLDMLSTVADNVWRTLLMFNWQGDVVYTINVPSLRQLGIVTAPFLLLGLVALLARLRQGNAILLLAFWLGGMAPTALSLAFPNEVPNAIRTSGALAPSLLLVALGFSLLYRIVATASPAGGRGAHAKGTAFSGTAGGGTALPKVSRYAVLLVAALLLLQTGETAERYFGAYVDKQPYHNYSVSLEMARAVAAQGKGVSAFVVVWPHWYDGNALRAQLETLGGPQITEIPKLTPDQPLLNGLRGPAIVVYHPADTQTEAILREAFPRAVVVDHRNYEGTVAFKTLLGER